MMRLAAALDLPVAPVQPGTVAGRRYLLVTRYDRHFEESGRVQRLHQEDSCQALGMKVATCATLEEIDSREWSAFANDAGIAAPYVRQRVKTLAESTQHTVAGVAERLSEAAWIVRR